MRRVLMLAVPVAVIGLTCGLTMAKDKGSIRPASLDCCGEAACVQPDECGAGTPEVCGCCATADCCGECAAGRCRIGCGRCRCGRHAARIAAIGEANCACRGSYKFPVPLQYTYHWPGMYSMQRMTDYLSPYRFPPLELPRSPLPLRDDQARAGSPVKQTGVLFDAPSAPADTSESRPTSTRPEPLSARLKARYGLR
jgi:hypothetical protein